MPSPAVIAHLIRLWTGASGFESQSGPTFASVVVPGVYRVVYGTVLHDVIYSFDGLTFRSLF